MMFRVPARSPWLSQGVWPVVLVALAVRMTPLPLIGRLIPGAQAAGFASDGTDYYSPLGHNLAVFHEFSLTPGQPTAAYVPLYPALLALLEVVGRSGPFALMSVQALLGALGLVLLFVWARQIAGAASALVGLGLAAVLPDFAVYSYLNMSENLFMVLMLAALVIWQTALEGEDLKRWALAGLLLGLAALTREFGVTLLLPLAGATWWHRGFRQAVLRVAVLTLASSLTILPWTLRNLGLFGEWIPLTSKGAVNIYVATLKGQYHPSDPRRNWALEDPSQEAVDQELKRDLAVSSSFSERNWLYLRSAWRNLTADPWGQVVYLGRKAGFFWQPNVGLRHVGRIGHTFLLGASEVSYWLCLVSAASIVLVRRRLDSRVVLPALLTAWTFLFHLCVGEAESRYHFALLPAIFVFSGMSLTGVVSFKPAGSNGSVRMSTR